MEAMILERCAPIEAEPLRRRILPDPEPGPGEIRVRVKACGVCRTDLHVVEGELPPLDHPVIPGHQVVGEVDALGPQVRRFRGGERVGIAWLRHTCGQCVHCTEGRENLCEQALFTGYHAPGGYATHVVVAEDFAYPIPQALDDAEATPLLCAGIIGYRSLKRCLCGPQPRPYPKDRPTLALYGFGSSAHIVIQIARHWGYDVYAVSRTPRHQQLALELGARWAGPSAQEMPVQPNHAIIFAPAGHLVATALEHLQKGGTLALAGIYMSQIPALDYEKHLFYEKNIHSVTANTRQDARELLEIAGAIPIRPEVHTYALEEANQVLRDLKEDKIRGTAVLVP
ncbi:alcohol dehydrogenase, propanol-preferring [Desulfacinum hydrothermale DSM 13146]|uniref:alcohol dehydrogenase n=1 Tax=Desulfacinum hydrothermale DSM 13146 TaxID=1121390 RepID=A0A1W1X318_9BACT|nr:zinc-dependent alcohol dehydrogenase family protein [Desulfacinum hydrothermale]SMC18118.1 alcohol dehydrogenase, propanol-preferring [Desulfacinum hydrothermale DSM 13146]